MLFCTREFKTVPRYLYISVHFALHMQISETLERRETPHVILLFVNTLQSQSHLVNPNYSMSFV